MQCADEYTEKLRSYVYTSFSTSFVSLAPMAEPALAELDSLAAACRQQAATALRRLAAALLPYSWLRVHFDSASFELTSEAAEAEAQRSFEHGLLVPLQAAIAPLRERLRHGNMELLVHMLAAALAEQLESSVRHKRFNEIGAMVLCEYVRRLVDALSEFVPSGSVRHEFSRLSQVAFLLNAGSVQEAASLLLSSLGGGGDARSATPDGIASGGACSVQLTRAEAARVLALRSDLSLKDELAELFEGLEEDDEAVSTAQVPETAVSAADTEAAAATQLLTHARILRSEA